MDTINETISIHSAFPNSPVSNRKTTERSGKINLAMAVGKALGYKKDIR